MNTSQTLTMIKPDAVTAGHMGNIIQKITNSGFKIIALKLKKLTTEEARSFYMVHQGKPFYESLVTFMTSGPIIAAVLEKKNAVNDFRTLIGATNPQDAAEGTIRNLYATDVMLNAIHGSDSDENAALEIDFHFNKKEII